MENFYLVCPILTPPRPTTITSHSSLSTAPVPRPLTPVPRPLPPLRPTPPSLPHLCHAPSPPGGVGSSEVLAEGAQSQGGDVPQRAGGDSRRHGAGGVCQGHAAAFPTDRPLHLQPSLPGIGGGVWSY